jgi:hypothetical protein
MNRIRNYTIFFVTTEGTNGEEVNTFFKAKDAVCPPLTSLTTMRFLWMLFTAMGMKCPSASGPRRRVSFRRITPFRVVPDTTVPTPCVTQISQLY